MDGSDLSGLTSEEVVTPEEPCLPRRRPRRDSGSQHAKRIPNGSTSTDCNNSFTAAPSGVGDLYHHGPHYPYEDPLSDHVADDDTAYPSNLYDIQERRESILSIEAVQEIARRFASTSVDAADEVTSDEDDSSGNQDSHTRAVREEKVPEYRKEPLSTGTRVANWLKGIQDPTEKVPMRLSEKILPDII